MEYPAFLASEYPQSSPEKARFHIIPVPLERSVSYGSGTSRGPAALLEASQQLEAWDGISAPGTLGFHTQEQVDCSGSIDLIQERISDACRTALQCGAVPVVLGGEHTVSYGAVRACAEKYDSFGVIHFDAHGDLRDSYEGDSFSHACVLRRIEDSFNLPLAQFGTRDYCMEELEYRKKRGFLYYDASRLAEEGLPEKPLPDSFPRRVYITFDVDGLDSSLMPATGTPSPGGLLWYDVMKLLTRCLKGREVIGLDVVELAPIPGLHHADFTAAKLTHALIGFAQRSFA